MNFKNLLKLGTLTLLVTLVLSSLSYGQVIRYLNSTDGRDDNDGLTASTAYRTLTAALADFPEGATVYMAAGNYNYNETVRNANGNDAAGYNLTGVLYNKSMTFVVQTYAGNDIAYLNGDGDFNLDIGATKTLTFQAADVTKNGLVVNPNAAVTTNFILTSGTLNVSGLFSFTIGAKVGTTAGGDAIQRANGFITGTVTYATAVRDMKFLAAGTTSINTGTLVPPSLSNLDIASTAGTITIPNNLTFGNTAVDAITATAGGVATVVFSGKVTLTDGLVDVTPTAVPQIINSVAGSWTFSGGIDIITATSDAGNGAGTIRNTSTGKILVTGPVVISQIDNAPGGTYAAADVTDGNHTTTFENDGAAGSELAITGGVTVNNTKAAPFWLYAAARTPDLDLRNDATGKFSLGGANATNVTGDLLTAAAAGQVVLYGNATVRGVVTNLAGHTINVSTFTLTLPGAAAHTNNGTITSGGVASTGLIDYTNAGANNQNGAGQLPSVRVNAGNVTFAAATIIAGNITANGAGDAIMTAATTVSGNVYLKSSGDVQLNSGVATIVSGNVILESTATGNFTHTGVLTVNGYLTLTGGTYTLGANATVVGDFTQNGGTLTFGANTLSLKKNFYRTVGTVNAGTGTLAFTLGGNQVLQGGSNFLVHNLSVNGLGTVVTINNGSVQLTGTCTIVGNTSIVLDQYNLRFVAVGSNMANAGSYTATNGGRVIFEGPDDGGGIGVAGTVHTITGNGSYGDMEIALADEADYVTIGAGETITFAATLILRQGTMNIPAGTTLNPALAGTAKIRRNMGDTNAAGADGHSFVLLGNFNSNLALYDLEYYGTLTGPEAVGNEFFLDGTNAVVRNVDILANDGALNANLIQFPNNATGDYKFVGNLNVPRYCELDITGASNLVSSGTGVAHSILGQVLASGAGEFQLTGTTVTGTTLTTAGHAAKVEDMRIVSGTVDLVNLQVINDLSVDAGTVTISMAQLAGVPGSIFNYDQNGGTVTLTNHARVEVFDNTNGVFDFANFNIWIVDLTAGVPADAFTAGGTASFLATGATTNGYLQFRSAAANLNTGTINIPRIHIDPANLAGGVAVTLTGNSGFTDIFTLTDPTSTLTSGVARTFRVAGNTWNTGDAAGVFYTGTTTTFTVSSGVTVNLYGDASIPNLTLNNGTNTASLVDMDGAGATVPSLTVTTLFTSTAGNLNLNACDIILSGAGAVFAYTDGMINATTTTTSHLSTDNQNGEIVFNNAGGQTFAVGTTVMVLPNVRIQGAGNVTLSTTNPFTISKRLVYGAGGNLVFGANLRMTLGDGAWVEVRGASTLSHLPAFAGVVDINYASGATIPVDKEMPDAGATLRRLFVNSAGFVINATKNIKVNTEFHLIAGSYDPEPGATTYTVEMGNGSTVNVQDGTLLNNAAATFGLTGGPVTLQYTNTAARNTSATEYPATAGFVSTLKVMSTAANAAAQGGALGLHANRSAGDFILETGTATPLVANRIFNLNGFTLTVTNTASSTLTRGVLSSIDEGTDIYTFATLASSGPVTSTANATITNTNITAPSLNLAGAFGKQDYDLDGALNNVLPAGFPSATISGPATVAAFAGNLTATGNITINGAHSNGTITASGDVTVTTGGSMAASSNLTFIGTANATLTVPTVGATIGGMTLNKTNNTNTITLAGGNLATTAVTNFVNGLFVTGANTLRMFHPLFAAGGQGFTRVGVTGTNISHVVGNVSKASVNAGGPGLGGSSVPRFEFPVGTNTLYRPVAITFNPSFGLPTMPNATVFSVSHVNSNPGGAVALPIEDGVAPGIDVARYPAFYWTIAATPNSIGPSTLFDLELTATGFTDYDDINNVRIIRRHGLVTDVTNQWLYQGTIGLPYDNEVNGGVPSIIQKNANAGLRAGGAVFTLGMKSNISIKTAIPKQWLVLSQGEKSYNLANVFEGNVGSLTFTAQSSNGTILTTAITGSTLKITPVAIGDAVVTIIASDAANNDFFAYSFDVNVGLTDVEEVAEIPTEFSLSQNYPNPFNPTTNIKFGLPKESNVTLRIFNILGEEVATLVNKVMPAGFHTINFDASRMTSGMYIYRIEADNFVQVKKMLLMK